MHFGSNQRKMAEGRALMAEPGNSSRNSFRIFIFSQIYIPLLLFLYDNVFVFGLNVR